MTTSTGERDLSLLMWFVVAAVVCLSTLVVPLLAPGLSAASLAVRDLGAQIGAATTGMQPSHIAQATIAVFLAATYHAGRVRGRLDG